VPGKVTALITRRIGDRVEVCVFDHAGTVQLPAGTLEPGEHPLAGAVREAWEETGLPHLEVIAEVATLRDQHAGDVDRHVFHLRATTPTPDEWWVLTPDGDGSQWRCRWVPIDGREAPSGFQARWLAAARDLLDPGPPLERADPIPDRATELFWAPFGSFTGSRALVIAHESERPPPDGNLGSTGAVCVTADGDAVIVTEDPTWGWGVPGGRPEGGETPEETLAREVAEEACARVVDAELLISHEVRDLDASRTVRSVRWSPACWARVEVDSWDPRFEKVERRLVPLAEVNNHLRWEAPPFVRWLDLARAVEARRAG